MTVSSDSWDEMQHESDAADPLVAELLGELRSWAAEPAPAPSAALATMLDRGQPRKAGSFVRATQASLVTRPPYAPRRKRMIVAKLAGLGVVAKAALGVGVATAAVATAGVTGVLPTPTGQLTTDVTVTVPTSVTIPDVSVPGTTPRVSVPGVSIPGLAALVDDVDEDEGDDDGATGKPADNHGACVSTVARDDSNSGRDHGRAVSAVAQSDCGKPASSALSSSASSTSSTSTTTTTLSTGLSENRGPGNSGSSNSGRGSSNNRSGSSNSGRN